MNSNILQVNFDEARQSQLPFVELLINLGYTYLSSEEVEHQRRGDLSKFILKDIAFEKLKEINSYAHKGQEYKFADKDILEALEELENVPYEGLIDTSRKVFNLVMPMTGSKAVKVFHDGKSVSKNIRFVDFIHPENNTFHVTVEFPAEGKGSIRPDIVVFVNGIPFAIVENKKSSVEVKEAVNQHLRNQQIDYCPKLYTYPQLLVGTNGKELSYGTTGTPFKFYATWKEKDTSLETQDRRVKDLVAKKIDGEIYRQLCLDLNGATSGLKQSTERLPTEQDRSVIALFDKARLLDLSRNFVLYDAGVKKLGRYQQYFAIKKILDRIAKEDEAETGIKRQGGLVWHTQGSGKSLTMVMFVRALIDNPDINNPRIILVTDRRDLDKQIGDTFRNCGLKKDVVRATSGEHLLRLIKDKELNLVTTLVHKFEAASKKRGGFVDDDKNIFILIDEAHRTQGGMANLEMSRVLPNACYIAFTGTPLMKKERASYLKFGGYIDKYTIDDAIKDKIILPLIYEGRYVDLEQNTEQIDRHMDRITENLSDANKQHLQRYVDRQIIKDNPQRITEIAYDVEQHYVERFQGTGLKAQLVAPSKFSAVLFQRLFEKEGKVRTAVIISDESGIVSEDDTHKKEVIEYLDEVSHKYSSLKSYEDEVIDNFKNNADGIEIIIVVDKLLTGFDAPRNTVLYLAKDLKDHNLLQAIARVNRLFENKTIPKTSGFIIDYSENAKNLDRAMKLFGNYAEEDVKGALVDVSDKVQELEQNYSNLHDMFNGLPADDEAYIQRLQDEPERRLFYDSYNAFIRAFNECLSLKDFATTFKHTDVYKRELKKFTELRSSVRLRYADQIDLDEYKKPLIQLLDKYIDAKGVELLTAQIDITDPERFATAIKELGSDKSKAEAIAAHTDRTIRERMDTDPEFYQRFSEKIQQILQSMRDGKMSDADALGQMRLIKDDVMNKTDDASPDSIQQIKGASIFYRNLKEQFVAARLSDEQYAQVIVGLLEVLRVEAVVDWHKNTEVKRVIANRIDDYLYDFVKLELGVDLSSEQMRNIEDAVISLAENNHDLFTL